MKKTNQKPEPKELGQPTHVKMQRDDGLLANVHFTMVSDYERAGYIVIKD